MVLFDVKFNKEVIPIEFEIEGNTTGDLLRYLEDVLGVSNSKILKLVKRTQVKKGKNDDVPLESLGLAEKHKIGIIGVPGRAVRAMEEFEKRAQERAEAEMLQMEIQRQLDEERRKEEERLRLIEEEERKRRAEERRQQMVIDRRRQEEERKVREQQRLEDAIRSEQDTSASITLRFQCLSSAIAGRSDIEAQQKMILPKDTLQKLVNAKISLPWTFRIISAQRQQQNGDDIAMVIDDEKQAYVSPPVPSVSESFCGVLDFEAPNDTAYVPRRILEELDINEGDLVIMNNVNLVPGTFIKLQPCSASWFKISELERSSVLEFELRKVPHLATGSTFRINYCGRKYNFEVLETQPDKVISIIDVDIQYEVSMPDLEQEMQDVTNLIEIGETQSDLELKKDEYLRRELTIEDPNDIVEVVVTPEGGSDVDLYIHKPEEDIIGEKVSRTHFVWRDQSVGTSKIEISAADPKFSVGTFKIAARAYGNDATFSLQVIKKESSKSSGRTIESSSSSSANSEICDNCGKAISKSAMTMHKLRCEKLNRKCPECGCVINANEFEKHMTLGHEKLQCSCGEMYQQDDLQIHKQNDCRLRLVQCIYCPLKVQIFERGPHQGECGLRNANCRICSNQFRRKELARHMNREHDVPLESISWMDWIH